MARKIEPILRENLLTLARAYATAAGSKSLRAVSRILHGDAPFFDKLADKTGSFTARKYDEVVAAAYSKWPVGSPMPTLVDPLHYQKAAHGPKPEKDNSSKKASGKKGAGKSKK